MQQFDPNAPFEVSDGGFNPTAPFEVVGAQPQRGLRQRVTDALDGTVANNVVVDQAFFPGPVGERVAPQLAEAALDIGAGTVSAIVKDPVRTLLTDPAQSIIQFPLNLIDAGAHTLQAGADVLGGNNENAQAHIRAAGDKFYRGAIGAAEAASLVLPTKGLGGAATRTGRTTQQALTTPTARAPQPSSVLDDFERVGVQPDVITATPNQTAARVAQPVLENALGGATGRRFVRQRQGEAQDALNRFADDFAGGSGRESAGEVARDGVRGFRDARSRYYDGLDDILGSRAEVQLPEEVRSSFTEVTRRFDDPEFEEAFNNNQARRVAERLSDGRPVSINDLRELRSEIREAGNNAFLGNRDERALARLQSQMTDALYAAVREQFGPRELQRMQRADTRYRLATERIRNALEPFTRDRGSAEDAFRAITKAAQTNGGDPRRLRALRRSLSTEQFDHISGGVLRDLGTTANNQFSPASFSTSWDKLSEPAKNILFNRRDPEVRRNIDALANVMGRQSRTERFRNFSQSGVSVQNAGTLVALGQFPTTTVTGIVGANVASALMMRPAFSRMLLQMERQIPLTVARTGQQASQATVEAAVRMRALAMINAAEQADPELRPTLAALREVIANDNRPEAGSVTPVPQASPTPTAPPQ